jgi:hypothetical protein
MAASDAEDATAAALRLESAASALAELAVVIPAEHAARDRQAAAAARVAATFRYMVTALNLGQRLARRIAFVSQAGNTGTSPGAERRYSAHFWRRRGHARAVRGHGRPTPFG